MDVSVARKDEQTLKNGAASPTQKNGLSPEEEAVPYPSALG
jgi:hypothetical protein